MNPEDNPNEPHCACCAEHGQHIFNLERDDAEAKAHVKELRELLQGYLDLTKRKTTAANLRLGLSMLADATEAALSRAKGGEGCNG